MERAPVSFAPPGRAICRYRLTRSEAVEAWGAPHYAPEGPRRLPAWGFRIECGLEIEIQLDEANEQALLHAELRELEHALRHLDLGDRVLWRMDEDREAFERALEEYHPVSWGRWTVAHRNAEGEIEPVRACLSPADAHCLCSELSARGLDVLVEEEPARRARDRRARLTGRRPAKRTPSAPRWEVWWIDDDGAESLVQLTWSEADGLAWVHAAAPRGAGRWDVRPRLD